jgi:hypothetical protein
MADGGVGSKTSDHHLDPRQRHHPIKVIRRPERKTPFAPIA